MTQILTQHDEIRQWAIARTGNPALGDAPATGARPILRIVFGQEALNAGENQYGDRVGGLDLVGWDDWFQEFDSQKLGLLVEEEKPGILDDYYEFVPRDAGVNEA
ncbi:hypothetical protein [Devosia sp.]|uniref:hypothetical protein n=1 Tax=Devosia sp. TaxID=1871048 RepID=UPI003BAA563B